ncbi:MAG: hypothetical protein J5873_02535 [Bacteroidales bacterium]|nr:hypothetical protein [Bacteroidales bacterium]
MDSTAFNQCCKQFCGAPKAMPEMRALADTYPYFQIARLMAYYGSPKEEVRADLAFRMEDRAFLYHLWTGQLQLMEAAVEHPAGVGDLHLPKEIHAGDNRSALQVLNDMLENYQTAQPKNSLPTADFSEEETYEDLGKSSNMERMNFISETLAKLYVEQKAYDRALKIYKALMEKHPEKSATFAAAIEQIKSIKNSSQK